MPEIRPGVQRLFRLPGRPEHVARDVDEEMRLHLELRAEQLVQRGLTADQARAEAARRFDPAGSLSEARTRLHTSARRREGRLQLREWGDGLRQDAAYAWRQFRRAPGFLAAAVLTLALGVGATTATFSALYAVVLRPLPLTDPERVVRFRSSATGAAWQGSNFAPGEFGGWQRAGRAWERLAMVYPGDFTVAGPGDGAPERVVGARVTADYFRVFGVAPQLGRGFTADEDRAGAAKVVVLSDRLWRRRFGARPDVVSQVVALNGERHQVLGVMPAALDMTTDAPELWTPAAFPAGAYRQLGGRYVEVVGRLRPGVGVAAAQAEARAISRALFAAEPAADEPGRTVRVLRYGDDLAEGYRPQLLVLFGAGAVVLLIACANVANLLAARGVTRGRELALRAALGAGRARIARQFAAESAVLAGLGAAAGVGLAYAGVWAITRFAPAGVPRLDQASVDGAALLVALAVAALATLLLGLLPTAQLGWRSLLATLQQGGRAQVGAVRRGPRAALVGGEVALALVLLVGAGLLLRSAALLRRVPVGYDAGQVLTARLRLPEAEYRSADAVARAYARIAAAAAAAPGTRAAALVSRVPLTGMNTDVGFVRRGDVAALDGDRAVGSNFRLVSPGYFATMGIPLVAGRDFSAADGPRAPRRVVVNATLARALGLGGGAQGATVGARIWANNRAFWYGAARPVDLEVVGVVGDIRDDGARGAVRPEAYFVVGQAPPDPWGWLENRMLLVARTRGDPAAHLPALRRAVASVDARLPLYDVRTMAGRLADAGAADRFTTGLLACLGAAALLLAAVGIYGVVAHFVARDAAEVGVRLALGARRGDVLRLLLARHLRPVGAGVAAGGAGALLAARALAARLYGVPPTDPVTLAGASALIFGVAALACWLPARRAAGVEPTAALRAP